MAIKDQDIDNDKDIEIKILDSCPAKESLAQTKESLDGVEFMDLIRAHRQTVLRVGLGG